MKHLMILLVIIFAFGCYDDIGSGKLEFISFAGWMENQPFPCEHGTAQCNIDTNHVEWCTIDGWVELQEGWPLAPINCEDYF